MSLTDTQTADAMFTPLARCWVCGGDQFVRVHEARMELSAFREQDPELARYDGKTFWLRRCRQCGFAQPDTLPTLDRYFDRIYNQQWSADWVETEFAARYKDRIFRTVLRELASRLPDDRRRLLDIGAHAGRFLWLAQQSGWRPEGVELNPRTAAIAAQRAGVPVHHANIDRLVLDERQYDAVVLTDVLEHIPDPLAVLRTARRLLAPAGWIAVKVPCGPNQLWKESLRLQLGRVGRVEVADNYVHINHFTASSLRRALTCAGFENVLVTAGAPELNIRTTDSSELRHPGNWLRLATYQLCRWLPGGVHLPLTFNLQAYARRTDARP